jgi:hypothetical protein
MTTTTTNAKINTYTKLVDGTWGVRVPSSVPPGVGSKIQVTKASGEVKTETVASIASCGFTETICRIAATSKPSASYRAAPSSRRASGAGSATRMAGYSSWCTATASCRCYDCQ